MNNETQFKRKLANLINELSLENECNVPDYLIADYLTEQFKTFCKTIKANEKFHNSPTEWQTNF